LREEFVNTKWLNINEDIVYRKIIYNNKYLLKLNLNERTKLGGTQPSPPPEVS
jgi:hypothetical protein